MVGGSGFDNGHYGLMDINGYGPAWWFKVFETIEKVTVGLLGIRLSRVFHQISL